ncbi:MAG: S9 family peptidase [Opitutaceae bacterium]|nr:S9 family peptidase [Opitutaceae bacterium]
MRAPATFLVGLALIHSISLSVSPVAAAPVKELPVETFFKKATLSGLRFSPNGKYVLCVVPYERRQNLAVIDLEKGTKNLLSNFKDRQVDSPRWAGNDRILFLVDDQGKEEFSLYAVNRDGRDPSNLVPGRSVNFLPGFPGDSKSLLVMAAMTHADWWDVAPISLTTGKLSPPVAKAPGDVQSYLLDSKNVVRIAVIRDGEQLIVLHRFANKEPWKQIASRHIDGEGWDPIRFDGDDRTLFVASDIGRKTKAVYRYDTQTGEMGELVHGDDTYDVENVVYDGSKKKVVAVSYNADRERFVWLDPELKKIHARMELSLPGVVHRPLQFSDDGNRIIFQSYGDRDPGVYYLFDRTTNKVSEIAVVKPEVNPEEMAATQAVSYNARDQFLVHAYLTLPVGVEPKKLPLIIHPHGGPYGIRDDWLFNPEVQFYANRGFAVLQINYRGSGGYGRAYEQAGFKKWGLEMQNDLSDGIAWAVAQGIADPDRVVISGASYGGYATMAGLTYTPELYVAGINYVGVTNILDLMPKTATEERNYWMRTRLGDLSNFDDRKRIHDTSPVHFADRVRVPLLMAYGKNDPRVKISHAYDIERALKKNDKPYELIVQDDEGHGFRNEENSIAFFSRVDAFLKKYVPRKP